ncbi:hypothetical protein PMAYCL1PPCAC_27178, partial [Pristionchus mayeri]
SSLSSPSLLLPLSSPSAPPPLLQMDSTTEKAYSFSSDWTWQLVVFCLLGLVLLLAIAAVIVYCCSLTGSPCNKLGCKLGVKKKRQPEGTPTTGASNQRASLLFDDK